VLSAITILFIFLFLGELFPGTPWVWTAGALAAAFEPLFGFMSGGVNNDNALNLCAAALLYCLARGFRRGLSRGVAIGIGAALALGLLSKLTMIGFVPAAVLGMVLLMARSWRGTRGPPATPSPVATGATSTVAEHQRILGWGALFAAVVAVPVGAWLLWDRLAPGRGNGLLAGGVGSTAALPGEMFSFRQELSRIWQLFLPHLWLRPQFGYLPLWRTWFKGFFGTFGWLDYQFSNTVFVAIAIVVGIVLALAAGELVRSRAALRRRWSELAVYVVFGAGLCIEIGVQSYRAVIQTGVQFEQPRYLLPLLALYAAIVALAVRLPGRRWGPLLGAAIVVLAIGHDVFSQLLTVARYYS